MFERNINQLPSAFPLLGTCPATQACASNGFEPATFQFSGPYPTHRATPVRTLFCILNSCELLQVFWVFVFFFMYRYYYRKMKSCGNLKKPILLVQIKDFKNQKSRFKILSPPSTNEHIPNVIKTRQLLKI